MAMFPLATTVSYKDKGRQATQTEWHNIILWRGLADLAQKFLHKGSLIYLEGKLRTRSWEDREGHKKFLTEIVGENFIMLDRRPENYNIGSSNANTAQQDAEEYNSDVPPPEDEGSGTLPF